MESDHDMWTVVANLPTWLQCLICILSMISFLSELLPLTGRTDSNGITHGLVLLSKKYSLRNLVKEQDSEEKK